MGILKSLPRYTLVLFKLPKLRSNCTCQMCCPNLKRSRTERADLTSYLAAKYIQKQCTVIRRIAYSVGQPRERELYGLWILPGDPPSGVLEPLGGNERWTWCPGRGSASLLHRAALQTIRHDAVQPTAAVWTCVSTPVGPPFSPIWLFGVK